MDKRTPPPVGGSGHYAFDADQLEKMRLEGVFEKILRRLDLTTRQFSRAAFEESLMVILCYNNTIR